MNPSPEARRALADCINARHEAGCSYRRIAASYPGVTFQTLNRIALSDGEWIPKDRHVLAALGLITRKRADEHTKRIRREVNKMARETQKAMEVG